MVALSGINGLLVLRSAITGSTRKGLQRRSLGPKPRHGQIVPDIAAGGHRDDRRCRNPCPKRAEAAPGVVARRGLAPVFRLPHNRALASAAPRRPTWTL